MKPLKYSKTQKSQNSKSLGIAFGGGGGFVAYYWGIAKYIQKNYDTSQLFFAGSSAGVVPAFLLTIDHDIDDSYYNFFLPWMKIAKRRAKHRFAPSSIVSKELFPSMKRLYQKKFDKPGNLEKVQNRLFTYVTRMNMTKHIFKRYTSMFELWEILCCSCAIPFVFTNSIGRQHKYERYMDGSFPSGMNCNIPDTKQIKWIKIDLCSLGVPDPNLLLLPATLLTWGMGDERLNNFLYQFGYQQAKKLDLSELSNLLRNPKLFKD